MTIGFHFGFENRKVYNCGIYIGIGNQAAGAPLIDSTMTVIRKHDSQTELFRFKGKGLLLTPWRRNQYGESLPQKMLVVGIDL